MRRGDEVNSYSVGEGTVLRDVGLEAAPAVPHELKGDKLSLSVLQQRLAVWEQG